MTVTSDPASWPPPQGGPTAPPPAVPPIPPPPPSPSPGQTPSRSHAAQPKREPASPERVAITVTLAMVAVLALWFVLFAFVFSGVQQSRAQSNLYDRIREELGPELVPIGGAIPDGRAIALVQVPSIGLDQVIVQGSSSLDLEKGPGHYPASPLPGQAGTSLVFGRSATFGAPFGKLHELKAGDLIDVTTGQGTFKFTVRDVRTAGDPEPTPLASGQAGLVLVTSTGSGTATGWVPSKALYVDAELAAGQKVVGTPAGQITVAPKSNAPFASDDDDLVPLMLWLEAFVLVVVGAVYLQRKLGGWQVWILAVPPLFAVMWGATSAVFVLLPNLA